MESTQMIPFIDAHTHRFRTDNVLTLYDAGYPALPPAEHAENLLISGGIHPYRAEEHPVGPLEEYLIRNHCSAIGECGLDRTCPVEFEVQENTFRLQAELAEKLSLPIVVHCVRAYPELIAWKKRLRSSVPWIVHGFRGNAENAGELLRHGMTLSLSAVWLLHANELYDCMSSTPFLLETDDGEADIKELYSRAAMLAGIPQDELKKRIYQTFTEIFHHVRPITDTRMAD